MPHPCRHAPRIVHASLLQACATLLYGEAKGRACATLLYGEAKGRACATLLYGEACATLLYGEAKGGGWSLLGLGESVSEGLPGTEVQGMVKKERSPKDGEEGTEVQGMVKRERRRSRGGDRRGSKREQGVVRVGCKEWSVGDGGGGLPRQSSEEVRVAERVAGDCLEQVM